MMTLRILYFALAVMASVAVARAQTPGPESTASPTAGAVSVPSGVNPYCGIQYVLFNWNIEANSEAVPANRMLGSLYSTGRTVGATILLFTDSQSFEVTIPQLRLSQGKDSQSTSMFLVELPESTHVRYAYVESYSINRAPVVRCSAMPEAIPAFADLDWSRPKPAVLRRLPAFAALSQGALPPTKCTYEFTNAVVKHIEQPGGVRGLDSQITSQIAVFLATDGTVAKAYIAKSSGNGLADALAEGAAMKTVYAPARFRCQPVVSEYLFMADFDPDSDDDKQ